MQKSVSTEYCSVQVTNFALPCIVCSSKKCEKILLYLSGNCVILQLKLPVKCFQPLEAF